MRWEKWLTEHLVSIRGVADSKPLATFGSGGGGGGVCDFIVTKVLPCGLFSR